MLVTAYLLLVNFPTGTDQFATISLFAGSGYYTVITPHFWGAGVTGKGKKECVDPEGNGVTMNEGAEGGPGPPSGE
jgi:hypothetical protein